MNRSQRKRKKNDILLMQNAAVYIYELKIKKDAKIAEKFNSFEVLS